MNLLRNVLIAHRVGQAVVVVAVQTGVGALAGRVALPIRLTNAGLTHRVPVVELVCLVCVVLLAQTMRPRLWIWQRLGAPRTRMVSALVAVLALAGVLPPVLVVLAQLPADQSWAWLVANVLVVAGATLVLCVSFGPVLGGVVALVLYFADAVLDNVVHGARDYLPLTSYPGPAAHWVLAVALDVLAIGCYVATHGMTRFARRMGHNEE